MRSSILLIFILAFAGIATAQTAGKKNQDKIQNKDVQSGEGSIMLNNDTELSGSITYNSRTGVVNFEAPQKSRTYTSLNIMGFEYFDAATSRQRIFFSIPYAAAREDEETEHFFEVLRQYKDFGLVDRSDYRETKTRKRLPPDSKAKSSEVITVTLVTEKVCFLQHDDKIIPYLEITRLEGEDVDPDFSKTRVIDDKVLSRLMGEKFNDVSAFAKNKGLSFKNKEDLVQIVDYYESLTDAK